MKRRLIAGIAGLLSTLFIFSSCSSNAQAFQPNYGALADSLQTTLYSNFSSANGQYFLSKKGGGSGLYYWPNAHALDVLADAYIRTQDRAYLPKMKTLLNGIKAANGNTFSNEYYDDMAWLALACLRVYSLTDDAGYLTVTKQLYAEIRTGANDQMGGGVAWRKGQRSYKNIPSTGNMCILAARLYQLEPKTEYLDLAKSLFNWMKAAMVNKAGQVQDGINRNNDGQIDHWIFTYTQGLYIGSGVELCRVTKDAGYLKAAIKTADNVLTDTALTVNGYLKNEGQGDHGLFKGVLIRYMTLLTETPALDKAHRNSYLLFMQRNAQALYTKGIARPSMMVSSDWTTAPEAVTELTTYLSGMMMIEAAAKLKLDQTVK